MILETLRGAGSFAPPIPGVRPGDRVLVLGAYGAANVGDEAILAGLLEQLGDRSRATVISKNPAETSAVHGVRAVPPRAASAQLRTTDVLVIGGGGLFSSHVGPFARAIAPFGLVAHALGKRVVIHGVSVDRTTPAVTRAALVALAKRAAAITVRDRASARLFGTWGVEASVTPDLSVYAWPSPARRGSDLLAAAGLDPERPILGLALTAIDPTFDLLFDEELPLLADHLRDAQLCFVPMSHHPTRTRHNDIVIGRALADRLPAVHVLEDACLPGDVMSVFGFFAAAVCMRFHSFLFAERAHVPIVGIPYAPKCAAWLAERSIPATMPGDGTLFPAVSEALAVRGAVCA